MKIIKLTTENLSENCITDAARPRISFAISSDRKDACLSEAEITLAGWKTRVREQILIPYGGEKLAPFTGYKVHVKACDNFGESDEREMTFTTGRMGTPWKAKWITDGSYVFKEKKVSPKPMYFFRKFSLEKQVARAVVYSTAIGIYELEINGKKVGDDYFAPGFTSYKTTLQYQTYDVTGMLGKDNEICAVVAGGWAVGSFVFTRKNRITANRQAFMAELRITYTDGTSEILGTDESWQVTTDGCLRAADFYDGEVYDASIDMRTVKTHGASVEKVKIKPHIVAAFGSPVRAHETFTPVSRTRLESGETVYDFGQNFAGVIRAKIKGEKGQKIVFRHAEVLNGDGTPAMQILRSAKATATYICADGENEYSPRHTYMGFRYVGVSGVEEENIELSAVALYSDIEQNGTFSCSDGRINKLQQNIVWSLKSNFMDIPTDCPQRDERMGWTGDIAAFAPTACYNYDVARFLEKWLNDLKSEQKRTGGIPNTIPAQGYGFPATMPVMAVEFWGDACILVPWAEYLARGDKEILKKYYPVMKKYMKACKFWAGLLSVGKRRYVWHTPAILHFGDWVAPYSNRMGDWQKKSKWTATASICRSSALLSKIANLLGYAGDEKYYKKLSAKTAAAYVSVFTDGNGKLKEEFQTGYVLPLAFGMFPEDVRGKAVDNLVKLVKENGYCIGTGFPGTPNILFALADNGRADAAYEMLFNEKCPSWLYEVKAGGTTVWELWDALKADGSLNGGMEDGRGGMISFNHYGSGAVGEFLYRRVLGVEATEGGYKSFRIKPVLTEKLTYAQGEVNTPYGKISSGWSVEGGTFRLRAQVPAGTRCKIELPDGGLVKVGSGSYEFECKL